MRWSDVKTRMESLLADSIKGRVEIRTARYLESKDVIGRLWIEIDGDEILKPKRFSNSVVNWRKQALGEVGGTQQDAAPLNETAIVAKREFHTAILEYLELPFHNVVHSANPVIRAIGMLDRRLDVDPLIAMEIAEETPLVAELYKFRCSSEQLKKIWTTSNDPYLMLKKCRRTIRERPRKGWLLAVACCRRIEHLLHDNRSRAAVEVTARFAEGLASPDELQAASAAASLAHREKFYSKGKVGATAEWAAEFAASVDPWFAAARSSDFGRVAMGDGPDGGPEHVAQAEIIRCIFGSLPYRSVGIDRECLTWNFGRVVQLAQSIYDENAFDRLPDLGDALAEAGCVDVDILGHCRNVGPHVRGCWVVDLILAKD